MARRNILYASRKISNHNLVSVDEAYETIKSILDNDRKSMWTSIEVKEKLSTTKAVFNWTANKGFYK